MLPNFLIIGAPRCGTTTLYQSLREHPEVFLSPIKEPMFFILESQTAEFQGPIRPQGVSTRGDYQSLFAGAAGRRAVGEASPCYLSHPRAPGAIRGWIPDVRMIAILRNPADRAQSHYQIHRLQGVEPIDDLESAMAAEAERIRNGWSFNWWYREMGFYGRQIERYFSLFPRGQFRFFLFEDLVETPDSLFGDIFRFLGIDGRFPPRPPERHNPSGIPRHRRFHDFITKPNVIKDGLKRWIPADLRDRLLARYFRNGLVAPPLDTAVRRRILASYREDILKTQDLIGRDLSRWLTEEVGTPAR